MNAACPHVVPVTNQPCSAVVSSMDAASSSVEPTVSPSVVRYVLRDSTIVPMSVSLANSDPYIIAVSTNY